MADWGKLGSRGRVQDRRAFGPASVGGIGIGGIVALVLINYLLTGEVRLEDVVGGLKQAQVGETQSLTAQQFEGADSYEVFAATVIGSTDEMWSNIFAEQGKDYPEPELVLFRGATESACGGAHSAVGPHYCPLDEKIYLDETFFDELERLGGQGDVAEAYVLAHEVGHHVQHQLGLLEMERTQEDSIAIELQADCLAGLWAYSIRDIGVFETGEIQEAMDAASAVGDDRVQATYGGRVSPESWTHGSSAQRVEAFNRGFETGSLGQCL